MREESLTLEELKSELKSFLDERDWLRFSPNEVFIHLIEELGEIGKHLLFLTEYKTESMGHKKPDDSQMPREFAQVFFLFLQLCIILDINIEEAWKKEFEIMKKRFSTTDT
ncbi:MAG: hypothetical protein KAS95_07185 [Candidatus Heimdallarchaeota archaeon]|nr:hypothetical protein [Candidatus Heimdallarchaeota archaeon]